MNDPQKRPPITEHPDLLAMDLDEKFAKRKHRRQMVKEMTTTFIFGVVVASPFIALYAGNRKRKETIRKGEEAKQNLIALAELGLKRAEELS